MDFLDLGIHDALLEQAKRRPGVDNGAVETLLTLQEALLDINRHLDAFFATYGLTQGRFTVLTLLMATPEGLRPSDLAERAGVTRATVTGLIDGLERDGLVRRGEGGSDRRTSLIKLTPVAHGLMEGLLAEYYRRTSRWLGAVSGGGRRTLIGALSTILDRMHANEDEPLPL